MTDDFIQLIVAVLALVFGAAFEEMLPKAMGVGFPVLLAMVHFFAFRRGVAATVLFALAAGAVEDALCALPPMTSGSYFLLSAVLVHWSRLPRAAAALTYTGYQVWLAVWLVGLGGGVFVRMLVALPIGLLTAFAVDAAMAWTWRKAAVDECA